MKYTRNLITCALLGASTFASSHAMADTPLNAKLDFRLRYEDVKQENGLGEGEALTLRTTVTISTQEHNGWSAVVDFEDVRSVLGIDQYNNTLGQNPTLSVIADPETTEFDQGYLQYKSKELTARIGRQVITLDDHRFIGSVIWRQDKQTFDAVSVKYTPNKNFSAFYAYLDKRNRIFAEERDLDSKDHLINVSYKTEYGVLTGYSYLLEVDNGLDNSLDTYGAFFKGSQPMGDAKFNYEIQYATQSSETATTDFDADFLRLEGGVTYDGVSAKVGYEVLGSDDGQFGFATPLSTLHKFNGWADQFLATPTVGLEDMYIKFTGSAYGGKWLVAYHDFSADEETDLVDDLGDEFNFQYTRKFKSGMYMGLKAAFYSEGDMAANRRDRDIYWLWVGKTF